ncbi:MAG: hypothetical protein ACTSP0_02800 [Alphaproteobacteria bacterium]
MRKIISISGRTERLTPANEPALVCREGEVEQSFHYWRGESGQRYVHTVFPLIDCPLMAAVNYILVYRDVDGVRRPLDVGRTSGASESLNLAQLRRRAALMGANEVHVHFMAETAAERERVEADVAARQLGRAVVSREFVAANDGAEMVCA